MKTETSNRPTIICHMVASIDGRIDCAMVDKISGEEYYSTLAQLACPSYVNGRVTMEHYHAEKVPFVPQSNTSIGKPSFYLADKADGYVISVDTNGKLAWPSNQIDDLPLVCIVSEKAPAEYLDYLRGKGISYIAAGKDKIDLPCAMEILGREFRVQRLALLGGGVINGGFLDEGLVDEVSLLIAPGIDGRKGRVALFDGIPNTPRNPFKLKLKHIEQIANGTVWLRYETLEEK